MSEFESARKETSGELRSIAGLKAAQLSAWYVDELDDASVLSYSYVLNALLERAITTGEKDALIKLQLYLDELKLEHNFEDVLLIGPEGEVLYAAIESSAKTDQRLLSTIRQAFVLQKPVSTDLFICGVHNRIHIDFVAPMQIKGVQKKIALVLRVNPDDFIFPLVAFWPDPGRTTESVLVRIEGDSVLILNPPKKTDPAEPMSIRISRTRTDVPAVKVAEGYTGIFEGLDYNDNQVISYLSPVAGTPWFMVTKIDRNEMMKNALIQNKLFLFSFVLLVVIAISVWLLLNAVRQRDNLRKLLLAKEEFRTTIYSIGDAVIITGATGLIANMNPVAEKLTGWTEKDAKGLSVERVFHIINEASREKVENPINRVLSEGIIVGLANHTLLVSKDGKEIPIADSGAPIRDDDGEITSVVLVFRDQTDEHAHQSALLESELRYRSMFESSPQPMWFYDPETLLYLEVNNAALQKYGYTRDEFLAMKLTDIIPEEDIQALLKDVAETNTPYNRAGIWRHLKKNREIVYAEITSHEIQYNRKPARHVLVNDVTDRIKADEALKKAERYFRTLIEKAPDGIVLINKEGKISYASPVAVKIFSAGDENAVPDPNEATHPEDLPKVLAVLQRVMHNPAEVLTLEYRFRTIEGEWRWVESTFTNQFAEPGIESIVINFRDVTDRKLAESEKLKFYNIIERSLDEIYVFEYKSLKFEFVNIGALNNLGYTMEQMRNMTPLDIKPEIEEKSFRNFLQSLINRGNDKLILNTVHKRKDGSTYPVEMNIQFFSSDEGGWFIAITDDISEKRHQENLLRESELKFRSLFENHSAVKLIIDAETGQISGANAAAVSFYGYSQDELTGMNMTQINRIDSRRFKAEIDNVVHGLKNHFEFQHTKKDGTVCDVEVFSSKIEISGKPFLHSIIHDITEKRKVEKQNRIFTRSIEQSPVGITITNADGVIEYANPKVTELTGYSRKEILGTMPAILRKDAEGKPLNPGVWEKLNQGNDWSGERFDVRKNGETYWENSVISPITDPEGSITNFVILTEDISNDRAIMAELVEAKNKAEESDRLKSAFLANMSHEIRTPMNGIMGFMDLLLDSGLSGEQRNEYVDIVKQSGDRLLNTINDIIDISKIEAGQSSVSLNPADINELLIQIYRFFRHEADMKNLDLKLTKVLPSSHKKMITDTAKLESVLINLIKNALKFTQAGSIEFGGCPDGDNIRFFVRDTGMGIPEDRIAGIFDRFVQADTTLSRPYEGSGLGLSISRAYVEMLGGEIRVESTEGKGTSFSFFIPFSKAGDEHAAPENYREKQATDFTGNTILIAEDDAISYSYLRKILQPENLILLRAVNGMEAVKLCRENTDISMVLMDIKMPVLDGYEATREILSIRPGLPVIATTAYAFEDDRRKAIECGCVDYISKPIGKEKLLKIIKTHLS